MTDHFPPDGTYNTVLSKQRIATAYLHGKQILAFVQRQAEFTANLKSTKHTRYIEPILSYVWASVEDGGPTLTQHWFNVMCLLSKQSQLFVSHKYSNF